MGAIAYRIGTEENSCPKDPLKRRDQPAVFLSALRHSKRVQHLGSRFETDRLALLADSEGGQKVGTRRARRDAMNRATVRLQEAASAAVECLLRAAELGDI